MAELRGVCREIVFVFLSFPPRCGRSSVSTELFRRRPTRSVFFALSREIRFFSPPMQRRKPLTAEDACRWTHTGSRPRRTVPEWIHRFKYSRSRQEGASRHRCGVAGRAEGGDRKSRGSPTDGYNILEMLQSARGTPRVWMASSDVITKSRVVGSTRRERRVASVPEFLSSVQKPKPAAQVRMTNTISLSKKSEGRGGSPSRPSVALRT